MPPDQETLEEIRFEIAQAYYRGYNFEDFRILSCADWSSSQDTIFCKITVEAETEQEENQGIFKVVFRSGEDEVSDVVAEYQGVEFGYPSVPFGTSLKAFS
jgi:hypothetical protein